MPNPSTPNRTNKTRVPHPRFVRVGLGFSFRSLNSRPHVVTNKKEPPCNLSSS
jgi:hypothetical protein